MATYQPYESELVFLSCLTPDKYNHFDDMRKAHYASYFPQASQKQKTSATQENSSPMESDDFDFSDIVHNSEDSMDTVVLSPASTTTTTTATTNSCPDSPDSPDSPDREGVSGDDESEGTRAAQWKCSKNRRSDRNDGHSRNEYDQQSSPIIDSDDMFSLNIPDEHVSELKTGPTGKEEGEKDEDTNPPYRFHTVLGKRLSLESGYWTVALVDITFKLKKPTTEGRMFIETDLVPQSNIGNCTTRHVLASVPLQNNNTDIQTYTPTERIHVDLLSSTQPIFDIRIHIKKLDGTEFTDIERPVDLTLQFTKYHRTT